MYQNAASVRSCTLTGTDIEVVLTNYFCSVLFRKFVRACRLAIRCEYSCFDIFRFVVLIGIIWAHDLGHGKKWLSATDATDTCLKGVLRRCLCS